MHMSFTNQTNWQDKMKQGIKISLDKLFQMYYLMR